MDSMSDWGIPSKVFFADKSIDLTPIDGAEFSCEVEPTRLDTLADMVAQESVDNARFKANDFDHTITMEVKITPKQMRNLRKMLRVPKLPRKLKKRVKKTCFTEYPKRAPRGMINVAFALNHPHLAHRVGLTISVEHEQE